MKPPAFTPAEVDEVFYNDAEYRAETEAWMNAPLGAPLEPGQDCPTCARRVPHPKKPSSPKTVTKSYRVPVDEAEAHSEVLETAARFLGCFERPHWQYQLVTLACALVLQDERLRGAAGRQP